MLRIDNKSNAVIGMVLLLLVGAFLRLDNLGRFGFAHDELFHVFGARSLLENGSLHVPAVGEYTRARPITYLTAASFRLLGESEFTARLPFALISLLGIVVGFWMVRRTLGTPLAWFFAGVMAVAPVGIELARETRMYSSFSLLYLAMSFFFIWGFEAQADGRRARWRGIARLEEGWSVKVAWLIGAGVVFAAAIPVHFLVFNFGITVAAYSSALLVYTAVTCGWRRAIGSKYAATLAGFVVVVLGLVLGAPSLWQWLVSAAVTVPTWAGDHPGDANFYRYLFQDNYPAFFFLFPLGAVGLIARAGRRGFFMAVSFAALFVVHSYVFGRKDERYIYYAFPFLILTGAEGILLAVRVVARELRSQTGSWPGWLRGLGMVSAAASCVFVVSPWVLQAAGVRNTVPAGDWKSLPPEVIERARTGNVMTANPLQFVYYVQQSPTYYVGVDEIVADPQLGTYFEGAAAAAETVLRSRDLMILTHAWHFYNNAYFSPDVREYVKANDDLEMNRDNRILVILPKQSPDIKESQVDGKAAEN